MTGDLTSDYRVLLARAAIRGLFDPNTLVGDAQGRDAFVYLAQRSFERQFGSRWLWMLDLDSREEGLAALPTSRKALRRFLEANTPEAGDAIGEMFQHVLGAASKKAALAAVRSSTGRLTSSLNADEQVRLFQVVATLVESNPGARDWLNEGAKRDIRRSAALKDKVDSLRTVLPGALRGRRMQRGFLLAFATHDIEGMQKFSKRVGSITEATPGAIPAALVAGVGGIGKSALLADVMRTLSKSLGATTIAFDFDSPALRQGNILAMAMEFSRQIALVEREVEEAMSASRLDLRHAALGLTEIGSYEQVSSVMLGTYERWKSTLAGKAVLNRPLVLFLDTFEEVVAASKSRLEIIAGWARELVGVGFSKVSLIISGRAVEDLVPASSSPVQIVAILKLGDLGRGAGRTKLRDMFKRHDIPHIDLVPALVDAFGSNPLVLEVLARFAIDKSYEEIASLMEGREAGSVPREGELAANFAQRFLYSRILERLPDDEMRKLARPGLVLRRVTPELITDVLAEPCGLAGLDRAKAAGLLARMKRVAWLVQPGGAEEEVLHRRDLRRIMLPLLLGDAAAGEVIRNAIRWYSQKSEPEARLEGYYYRGLNGDDLGDCSEADLRSLADLIGTDVDDLPLALRARIKLSAGMKLRAEEIAALPDMDRETVYEAQAATLVSEGLDSAAQSLGEDRRARPIVLSMPRIASERVANDAEIWRFELSRSSDAQSRFNTRQFEALSRNAAALVRHLLRTLAAGESRSGSKKLDNLAHPAYLATLSTFVQGRDAARDEIREFLQDSGDRLGLETSIRNGLARPLDGRGEVSLALLCLHGLGMDLRELPGFVATTAMQRQAWIGATSQAAWRIAVIKGRYGFIQAVEPSFDVFPLLSATLADIISPGFAVPGTVVHAGSNSSIKANSDSLDAVRDIIMKSVQPGSRGLVPQSLVSSLRRVASQSTITVEFGTGGGSLPEHFALGRIPELRGPVRSELRSMSVERLSEIVDVLSGGGTMWPAELTRAQAGDDMAKLVPPLVEAIDDSGQWARVSKFLGRDKGTATIIEGMRSLWTEF